MPDEKPAPFENLPRETMLERAHGWIGIPIIAAAMLGGWWALNELGVFSAGLSGLVSGAVILGCALHAIWKFRQDDQGEEQDQPIEDRWRFTAPRSDPAGRRLPPAPGRD